MDRACHVRALLFRISPSQQFFFYEDVQPMSSFFLKFCHSFHLLITELRVVQFCQLSYSRFFQFQTTASRSSDFVNHSYDYRRNWTPLNPIAIINSLSAEFSFVVGLYCDTLEDSTWHCKKGRSFAKFLLSGQCDM